jgi:hypothetical protein
MGNVIQSLIAEGACVGLWDFRSGTAYDWSRSGNSGIFSAGMRQIGPGGPWVFPNTTDEVTVADAASLRLTAGAIVAYSEHGFTSQVSNEFVLSHRSGAQGYRLYISNVALSSWMDGTLGVIATSIVGSHSVGMSFTSGALPVGYKDGLSLGNFSAFGTVTAVATTTELGNYADSGQLRSPLSAVLLANRVLTATEHAAVYAELAAARWPSSQSGMAKRVQGSVIGEANLLAGYTLRPTGGTVPSHDGAFTGALSGNAMAAESILGPALAMGRTTGAVDLGVGNAQIDPTTDSHWVEVWARPLDVAMSDAAVPIIGKGTTGGYWSYGSFGVEHEVNNFYLYWVNATPAYARVAGPKPRNKLTHLLYQVDRVTNNAYLYVDGVQYGPTAITTVLAAQATNWIVGKTGSTQAGFDEGFGGLVVCPRIGTGVLTPAQVQARYLEGARAVQFKTDWAYPISSANEGGVTGQQIGGHASPFRAGDAVGRWAVEAEVIDGEVHKVVNCKTAGLLQIDGSYFHQATATERAFGTFHAKMYKTDAGVITWKLIGTDFNVAANGYAMVWAADESVVISELGIGNVVAGGAASHSTWHDFDVTRALTGLFTPYVDSTSFGTGTDTTTTTSVGVIWDMDAGCKLDLGPVGGGGVMKLLGVVAP